VPEKAEIRAFLLGLHALIGAW